MVQCEQIAEVRGQPAECARGKHETDFVLPNDFLHLKKNYFNNGVQVVTACVHTRVPWCAEKPCELGRLLCADKWWYERGLTSPKGCWLKSWTRYLIPCWDENSVLLAQLLGGLTGSTWGMSEWAPELSLHSVMIWELSIWLNVSLFNVLVFRSVLQSVLV